MIVHLIGPMTGRPSYNITAFLMVKSEWERHGHTVTTPFTACDRVWLRHYGKRFDPRIDTCEYGDPLMPEMIEADQQCIKNSDLVVVLDGWERSKGTGEEIGYAVQEGKMYVYWSPGRRAAGLRRLGLSPVEDASLVHESGPDTESSATT